MKCLGLIAFFLLTVAGQANETISCNEHGAIVVRDDGTVLYMGKDCDALNMDGDEGRWWNAASFLAVEIDGKTYRVAEGQGIDCLPFCKSPY